MLLGHSKPSDADTQKVKVSVRVKVERLLFLYCSNNCSRLLDTHVRAPTNQKAKSGACHRHPVKVKRETKTLLKFSNHVH